VRIEESYCDIASALKNDKTILVAQTIIAEINMMTVELDGHLMHNTACTTNNC
jgi:hypothetical protein